MHSIAAVARQRNAAGFTLLELLVAIAILAFVSMIAWRGLDSLIGTRARLEPEGDAVRALLTTFGQVERDLAHVTAPSVFALAVAPVRVQITQDGPVLELVRIAPRNDNDATAVQTVFYRVADGALYRQASPPRATFGAIDADKLSNVRLLSDVKSLRIRIWRDQAGWVEPGNEPPATPGIAAAAPPGVEFTVELTDGRVFRRVVLVG